MGMIAILAYVIDWGWLRIGPPYIYINIDPVLAQIGPLALHWYGLMYVVGILVGLWAIRGYTRRKGINGDLLYRLLWWCIVAGLIGGRLYFVIQQPDLWQDYVLQPWRILATWEGGMAFFGAIFLVIAVLFWRAHVERVNPLVLVDAGVIFATAGQIFGRIGNLINGDIIGYPSTLPWSTVYDNPNSWACLPGTTTCHVPVQPSAAYELLLNIVLIALLLFLARRYRKPGALMATYLFGYCVTQFTVFFARANIVVPLGPLDWGLKQAQWTAIIFAIVLIPITIIALRSRFARPVPEGEIPATYGMPQKALKPDETEEAASSEGKNSSVTTSQPVDEEEAQPASVGAESTAASDEAGGAEEPEG